MSLNRELKEFLNRFSQLLKLLFCYPFVCLSIKINITLLILAIIWLGRLKVHVLFLVRIFFH